MLEVVGLTDKADAMPAQLPVANNSGWQLPGHWPCILDIMLLFDEPTSAWIRKWLAMSWALCADSLNKDDDGDRYPRNGLC